MHDSAKYLIHADVRARGVVERSDVVGAVFGQTEGLLGDGLDLRDLQESGKLGRIDVHVESERGSSFGEITIASGLDRVETAILAAALESIERVGPCLADVEVAAIEDVRTAKRRDIVERAKELLAEFDETALSSDDIVDEVRRSVRVVDVTDYRGLPAGPRVADSDAVVIVEGRADVGTLLEYGIKNAVAVQGTDVPDAVAELTTDRTVTAFLDGDRAGDLILRELAQVSDVDYVALAPADRSVEDLSREEVLGALRDKVPFDAVSAEGDAGERAATDGSVTPAPPPSGEDETADPLDASGTDADEHDDVAGDALEEVADGLFDDVEGDSPDSRDESSIEPTADANASATSRDTSVVDGGVETPDAIGTAERAATADEARGPGDVGGVDDGGASTAVDDDGASTDVDDDGVAVDDADGDTEAGVADRDGDSADRTDSDEASAITTETLAGHVAAVVGEESGTVRFLDADLETIEGAPVADAFDRLEAAAAVPETVVLDGELNQRLLDVAAQRGVERIVARSEGEFVKKPADVRVRVADEF